MRHWNLPITQNPLRTREDLHRAFQQLSDPLKPYYSKDSAHLYIGTTGASYSNDVAGLEGFARVLWGLVPVLAAGDTCDLWETYVQGIKNGTDPSHDEYWGSVQDYDQKSVEMAAFGFALAHIPDRFKEAFNEMEMQRLFIWLDQISSHKLWDCNWLFFLVLVQIGFKKAGLPYNEQLTEQYLLDIERFYLTDGWYADGVDGHSDYYVPFAIHYYGLLYAKLMEDEDPERSRLYKDRASVFAQSFIHWFAEDGSALPYGRSLTYRFAQSAFWSALAYAEVEPFSLGVIKGLILRNLRWWFQQPIFYPDGTLSIGYAYPNLVMAENYNAPGSPYWALKTFLPLALQADHPFWQAEELPLPHIETKENVTVQQPAHLVICRDEAAPHVLAFNTGHLSTNEHTHTSAKYEKFVYSTFFGFSVPRAEWGLGQGAYDSMLALSEGDNLYRVKRISEETFVHEDYLYTRWKPWADVEVETWLIPGTPWHVRVHRILSNRILDLADGGFALGIDNTLQIAPEETYAKASTSTGASGVRVLYGNGKVELIYPNANTNLLHPRTVIPTVRMKITQGCHYIVTAVYGEPAADSANSRWSTCPQIHIEEGELVIVSGDSGKPLFRKNLLIPS